MPLYTWRDVGFPAVSNWRQAAWRHKLSSKRSTSRFQDLGSARFGSLHLQRLCPSGRETGNGGITAHAAVAFNAETNCSRRVSAAAEKILNLHARFALTTLYEFRRAAFRSGCHQFVLDAYTRRELIITSAAIHVHLSMYGMLCAHYLQPEAPDAAVRGQVFTWHRGW